MSEDVLRDDHALHLRRPRIDFCGPGIAQGRRGDADTQNKRVRHAYELAVEMGEDGSDKAIELAQLLIARRPDRPVIDAGLDRLRELQSRRQQLIVDHLLRFSDLLDDEQREECRDMVAELLGANRPGG